MASSRAQFDVSLGPNEGDTIRLELGTCRLIGRHLSEHETALIDRDGNRALDATASELFTQHLTRGDNGKTKKSAIKKEAAVPAATKRGTRKVHPEETSPSFERGPDLIFQDDAISRAHAMLFFGPTGIGVIDLASTNGTFVNNERVVSTMLSDGDVIGLGDSEMTLRLKVK